MGKYDSKPYHIGMHPIIPSVDLRRTGLSPAALRIGILLHELVHCFLHQFSCTDCLTHRKYQGVSHGRGFQLLAKAIEHQAPRLLGTSLDLARLSSVWADMNVDDNFVDHAKPKGPSACDMEVCGFLKSLRKRARRRGMLGRKEVGYHG